MRSHHVIAATALLASTLAPRAADAFCGFYVGGADTKLYNNATQVALMRDGQRTVLSMQNAYKGPPENFAMVVPVPVVLQKENVKTLPPEIFDRIDTLTAPRLVEYWEQDPCAAPALDGLAQKRAPAAGGAMAKPASNLAAHDLGVKVEAQFAVGEYEIVILSARDSTGLATWLVENKYKIPDGAEPYLRQYVDTGSKFFVAKVNVAKVKFNGDQAVLSPLRFFYDAERFTLPIRLGLINSNGAQDLIVTVLAKGQRYEAANYANVTIPTNLDVSEDAQGKFGEFYAALFDKTIEQRPRTMVTEYAWGAQWCDPCPGPQAALTAQELATLGEDVLNLPMTPPAGSSSAVPAPSPSPTAAAPMRVMPGRRPWGPSAWVVTRLHARYSKDVLGDDLVLKAAPPIVGGREMWSGGKLEKGALVMTDAYAQNNFQARYAIRHAWKGEIKCENPVRGRWGGPPNPNSNWQAARSNEVKPATKLAFAPRGGVQLAALLREDVPEIALLGAAPDRTPAPTIAVADVPTAPVVPASAAPSASPPTKSDAGGCGACAVARSDGGVIASALSGLVAVIAAARRKRRP